MKRNYAYLVSFALVLGFVLIGLTAVCAQKSSAAGFAAYDEFRPFDFSDESYFEHGVEPSQLIKRRNGMDGISVFDFIGDPRYREIRILGVYAAYNEDGKIVFWNLYGELYDDGFRRDRIGKLALDHAHDYPLYIFPSAGGQTAFRQSPLIRLGDSYFEKNFLGTSAQILVEFTDLIHTKEGQTEMAALAARNGISADGTPIIKTEQEIDELTYKNYITQRLRGGPGDPPYAIAKVIENPENGAIAHDAFLLNNLGLDDEQHFVVQFECLQKEGKWCEK